MNQKSMKSITIHQLDNTLASLIQQEANRTETSLNKTIKRLLEKALGISQEKKKSDFSEFCGVWTDEEYKEIEKNLEDFERIDPEDWK